MRIGIPQGLLYFKYGGLWKKLLSNAGAEVVISPETTEDILADGIRHSVSDLCLPVKAFFGHVQALKDDVDLLFIPRMIRIEDDAYLCPKLIGLPDMVRAAIRNLPEIIDTEFNIKEKPRDIFWREVMKGLKIEKKISLSDTALSDNDTSPSLTRSDKHFTIGVAGRPYLVLDNHLNKGVIRYISSLGIKVNFMHDTLDKNYIRDTMERLPKWVYWSMCKEVVSSVRWMLEDESTHGIVLLSNTGCGPDSFIAELIERALPVEKKPYMSLKIDEHASDIGIKTRIEAFVDMIERNSKINNRMFDSR